MRCISTEAKLLRGKPQLQGCSNSLSLSHPPTLSLRNRRISLADRARFGWCPHRDREGGSEEGSDEGARRERREGGGREGGGKGRELMIERGKGRVNRSERGWAREKAEG
jgi:hypothetical protein